MRKLHIEIQTWPVDGTFVIARGAKREAVVVVSKLSSAGFIGLGECVPYARYGETPEQTTALIERIRPSIEAGASRSELQKLLPPGAARNALDCALWDLEAKQARARVWTLTGLPEPQAAPTAKTISVGTPQAMAAAARRFPDSALLKVKLTGDGDDARITAVRAAAPRARLIADANESWTEGNFASNYRACQEAQVELIEQPLADGQDALLETWRGPIPICADESAHNVGDLEALALRYQAINIKLDKTGGLTAAIALAQAAKARGFRVMVGCMVATSLSMAQASPLMPMADWVDLDGPLLLAKDRVPGLRYADGLIHPPTPEVWG